MIEYPKISIVTPSYNDAPYIEQTILSIVNQHYPNLEYIIIDGGSTDGTIDIIKKYANQISYWVSEKDNGMYHAIQKGFDISTGEVMGWINSDDQHQPGSLFMLAQLFSMHQQINWIQGTPSIIDINNRIVYASPREDIDKLFFYSRKHIRTGKFIQQESTFWRRNLWDKAGKCISQQYKYAGDFDLWIRFFQFEKLYNVYALLGSFRMLGKEQASINHYHEYIQETLQILENYPLQKGELRYLKFLRLFNSVDIRAKHWKGKIMRKLGVTETVVSNKIHYDFNTQQFKIN